MNIGHRARHGRREKRFAFVRVQRGRRRIATRHQLLDRIRRCAEFQQIALVEQANFEMAVIDARCDKRAFKGGDPIDAVHRA